METYRIARQATARSATDLRPGEQTFQTDIIFLYYLITAA